MKNLENLRSLIGAFDAIGGYFAVHKGTLNDNGLVLRDEMLAELKQAEAEHSALVAVAEAAEKLRGQFAFAAGFKTEDRRFDELLVAMDSLTTLRAGQPATGSGVVDHRPLVDALDKIASWSEGDEVSSRFDEPCAAKIAREALATVGVVGGMTGSEVAK